jgi:hypothetical protein
VGLDINVYDRAEWCRDYEEDWWEKEGASFVVPDKYSQYQRRPHDLKPGVYETGQCIKRFRAGSYAGYGVWRKMLCQAVHGVEPDVLWENQQEWVGKPFFELINFSDCEGVITGEVCTKLAVDFSAYAEEMRQAHRRGTWDELSIHPNWAGIFWEKYQHWMEAFEIASPRGAVHFC